MEIFYLEKTTSQRNRVGPILLTMIILSYVVGMVTQLRWFYGLLIIAFILTLINQVTRGRINCGFARHSGIYWLGILGLVSSAWSVSPSLTALRAIQFIGLIWLFSFTLFVSRVYGLRWTQWVFICVPIVQAIVAMALIAIYGQLRGLAFQSSGADVVQSLANWGPAISELCAPFVYSFICRSTPKHMIFRMLCYVSLVSWVFLVLVSDSRGAYLCAGIEVVCFSVLMSWSHRGIMARVFFIIPLMVLFASVYIYAAGVPAPVQDALVRFESTHVSAVAGGDRISRLSVSDAPNARIAMYQTGIEEIEHYWLQGAGLGATEVLMERNYGYGVVSHNVIISTLGELGILGFILFSVWSYRIVRDLAKLRRFSKCRYNSGLFYMASACLVAFVVAIFHGLFRPLFTNPLFYVVAALSCSVVRELFVGSGRAKIQAQYPWRRRAMRE